MTHFAVLCPEATGHLNPMTTLLSALRERGHAVTWIGTLDGVDRVRPRGFETVAIAEQSFPRGSLEAKLAEIGQLAGFAAARCTLEAYREGLEVLVREAPPAIRACGAEALVADESIFVSRTIAEHLAFPWVTVCNALPFHPDPEHPPMLPAWRYRRGVGARIRNYVGQLPGRWMLRPIGRVIAAARRDYGLPPYDFRRENPSTLATLAQIPAEFDYPRRENPPWLHYVGALHSTGTRPDIEFPFDRLDERPLIYVSLGTVQNRVLPVFQTIAAACSELPVQLVISLGGGHSPADVGSLPGDPIVVGYAPQLELIQRAAAVITHAGMNTTMEALAAGKPLLAIPITNDQPAVAQRIRWCGCGVSIPLRRVSQPKVADGLRRVLDEPAFTANAERIAAANRAAGGPRRAAEIIENAVTQQEPPPVGR